MAYFLNLQVKIFNVPGKLYMIPVTLGSDDYRFLIPEKVTEITRSLRVFIVENTRTARRFLRMIDKSFPIDDTLFFELNEHTPDTEVINFLDPVFGGKDAGLMSEAGLPGIADPGARIVSLAHRKKIRVIPLSGPSSIIMALIASGLNGQNFAFNGYLPVKEKERTAKIRELENKSGSGQSQIFMEAPYRNQKILESVLNVCNNGTRLCIATDISMDTENIRTQTVSEWKKNIPEIKDHPTIFIIQ